MSNEFKLPDIGIDKAEVVEILVKVGDIVKIDQPVIIIEGDKVSIEVPSSFNGRIEEIKVNVGDIVNTGSSVIRFSYLENKNNALTSDSEKNKNENVSFCEEKEISALGFIKDEAEVIDILVKEGSRIEYNNAFFIVKEDNEYKELISSFSGIITKILVKVGDKIKNNSVIMLINAENDKSVSLYKDQRKSCDDIYVSSSSNLEFDDKNNKSNDYSVKENQNILHVSDSFYATPVVRKLSKEFGIDLKKISGSGRKNRILREDIYSYIRNAVKYIENDKTTNLVLKFNKELNFNKFGNIKKVDLSKIQKVSGTNLYNNWITIPHVTQFDKSDITETEIFRKKQNNEIESKQLDVKITLLIFIIKVISKALEQFPRFNSSLSNDGNSLILKEYINIGVAVDTKNGLIVPVIKNTNKKNILELAFELKDILKKIKNNKLSSEDMNGGCFTVSSLGGIGGTYFTPIINAPEVAILGISKSSMEYVWDGEKFKPRLMLPMSLSYDHRVIDGADGVRFIKFVSEMISDIRRIIM